MVIIKGKSAFLSNYEVMQLLQQIKDNAPKKHIMEGSLATVTYEKTSTYLKSVQYLSRYSVCMELADRHLGLVIQGTIRFLQDSPCKNQSPETIATYLEEMKQFSITKFEKLMMLNYPPRTELEIQLMVQESEERLSDEDVEKIIDISSNVFPPTT